MEVLMLRGALDELVYLQAHYARLLNDLDGGSRTIFKNAQAWIDRMDECGEDYDDQYDMDKK
jgi:hypothetical protein